MNEKIIALIDKLISNTEKNKISWEKTSRDTEFKNDFLQGSVTTDKWGDDIQQTQLIDFRIFNINGEQVENLMYPVNDDEAKILLKLYTTINNKYLRIDETIDGIFSELE